MPRRPSITRPTRRRVRRAAAAVASGLALAASFGASPASAAAFGSGNVVVCRVGAGGAATLVNTGNPVFLDEYTPAGTLVQSIPMPTTTVGANRRLVASGTATSECQITRSTDGRYVIVTGYDAPLPTASLASSTSASVPRVIGRVDASGNVDTSTALTDAVSANNPRSAVSDDGTRFWIAGGAGGVRFVSALGATTSTQIDNNVLTNLRQLHIFGGQLFTSTSSGSAVRVGTVGSGLPTTTGQAITNLPGFPTTGSPYSYFLVDLSGAVPGVDTLYVADDSVGILKYSLVGASWTANGTVGAAADSYRGLTASVTGTNVTLFASRKGGSTASGGGELVTLLDTSGYNATLTGTPTLVATAATNTAFRGVALAPLQAPAPVVPETPLAIVLPVSALLLAGGFVATRRSPKIRISA